MQPHPESDDSWSVIDGLRVITVGDAAAPRQVLVFLGFAACVEPFELQRFTLLAATWDTKHGKS